MGYYKLSSAAAVVLQKYSERGGTKSEVLTFEIAPHSRKAGRREGGPSLILSYSPGIGVRGFPLTSA